LLGLRSFVRKTRPKSSNRRPQPREFQDPPKAATRRLPDFLICLTLLMATFAVYAQVRHFDFINLDDPAYISGNAHVRRGISPEGVIWAFRSADAANWLPVTWISHMLDCQVFGLESGWHHVTNVLLHALSALLLFAFLRRATGARWCSAWVALLFAVHPLHVESVAWVAERKDVLSAFFWFLTMLAYVRYTERPGSGRYIALLVAFCFGLMAKPMAITLPFVLLLLDVWPLRRLSLSAGDRARGAIVLEKVPLVALSLLVSTFTWLAQQRAGAIKTLGEFPLGLRLENALVSYAVYIVRMFWPTRLAVFYPHPQQLPVWQVVLAGVMLAGISTLVVRARRDHPYLATSWFWYLVTLVPVIGLVQVGAQANADRYMYIPMVGLSILLAWGVAETARGPQTKRLATVLMSGACLACAGLAWFQIQYWRNSETLFRHALSVTTGNVVAHTNLAICLMDVPGGLGEAVSHLETALRIDPDSVPAHTELGSALARIPGRLPESFRQFQVALQLAPEWPVAHNELGSAWLKAGRLSDATAEFATAVRLDPGFAEAHFNLGVALSQTPGRLVEAVPEYQAAVRAKPGWAEAQLNLGNAMASLGRLPEAIQAYQVALRIRPDYAEAHYNMGRVLSDTPGRVPDAMAEYQAALRLNPHYAEAHNNLGNLWSQMPARISDAIAEYEAALRIDPDYADAHYDLGVTLCKLPGRKPEALAHLETALRLKPNPQLRQAIDQLRSAPRKRPF